MDLTLPGGGQGYHQREAQVEEGDGLDGLYHQPEHNYSLWGQEMKERGDIVEERKESGERGM